MVWIVILLTSLISFTSLSARAVELGRSKDAVSANPPASEKTLPYFQQEIQCGLALRKSGLAPDMNVKDLHEDLVIPAKREGESGTEYGAYLISKNGARFHVLKGSDPKLRRGLRYNYPERLKDADGQVHEVQISYDIPRIEKAAFTVTRMPAADGGKVSEGEDAKLQALLELNKRFAEAVSNLDKKITELEASANGSSDEIGERLTIDEAIRPKFQKVICSCRSLAGDEVKSAFKTLKASGTYKDLSKGLSCPKDGTDIKPPLTS